MSSDPDPKHLPSGVNAISPTQLERPSFPIEASMAGSQSRTVLSDLDARLLPSDENATSLTQSEWSRSVPTGALVAGPRAGLHCC